MSWFALVWITEFSIRNEGAHENIWKICVKQLSLFESLFCIYSHHQLTWFSTNWSKNWKCLNDVLIIVSLQICLIFFLFFLIVIQFVVIFFSQWKIVIKLKPHNSVNREEFSLLVSFWKFDDKINLRWKIRSLEKLPEFVHA